MAKLPSTMPGNNLVVLSTLKLNTYKLTFKVNNTIVKTSDVKYTFPIAYPSESEYAANVPVGYKFTGWDSSITEMPAHDVTINAVLTEREYKVIYYVYVQQEGSTSYSAPEFVTEQTWKYGAAITPPTLPTFAGWGTDGWENLPEKMPAETLTINAYFRMNQYTATFKVDGVTVGTYKGQWSLPINAPINDPVKDGYNFVGWDTSLSAMPRNDVTINAIFEKNKYSISYYVRREYNKGGKIDYTLQELVDTQLYTEGETIKPPALPTEEGYTASDWEY